MHFSYCLIFLGYEILSYSLDSVKYEFIQSYISQNTQFWLILYTKYTAIECIYSNAGRCVYFEMCYHLIWDEEIKISRKVHPSLKKNAIVSLTDGKLLTCGINMELYQYL